LPDKESKYSFIKAALDQRREEDRFRALRSIESFLDGPFIKIEDKKLINFCSNDYLGLASHPSIIERSKEYLEQFGAGSASSRLISGTLKIHSDIEKKLAEVFEFESVLIFNSGFQANVSIISAIADRNSLIILDKKCHNSLVQGSILSRATIKRFHHNDSEHLESLLKSANQSEFNRILIITETIFSMDGDQNKLDDLIQLSEKYDALLYSDDAHALGVLGENGLGLNYRKEGIDFRVGTFGKSFGGFGAFVGCSTEIRDYLINFSSGFIYTTALPPSVIGGLSAALDLIPFMQAERTALFKLIDNFKLSLRALDFNLMESESQIIPIIVGSESETIMFSNFLQERGLWVSSIRPPTVEEGTSRLRITLTVKHEKDHVDALISSLKEWKYD